MNVAVHPDAFVAPTTAIGRKAIYALYAELALNPKPGLVSPFDSGAHDDMDMATFMRSLFALRGYYRDIACAGARKAQFEELQRLGVAAERRMIIATRGANTHRGAIFTLGLLAAAAGALLAQGDSIAGAALGRAVVHRWGEDIRTAGAQAPASHGAAAARRYGVGGARQQAAAGFPLVFDLAAPTLEATLLATGDRERALTQTLFVLMAELDDTNVLHRGGAEGLAYLRAQARAFLTAGGVHCRHWRTRTARLHRHCVAHRLSPGGSADLLAAAVFVHALRTGA